MESGNSIETGVVCIPATPGKPPLTSEQGTEKENTNEQLRCTECFDTIGFMDKCVMNEMCELPPDILGELEEALGVVGKEKDHKDSTWVRDGKSCLKEEEMMKSSYSEHDSKKACGVDELQDDISSVPTPSKTKETGKRRNDGKDMNKKPSQRPRMKKHRPKIFDESKPKKVAKVVQTPRVVPSKPKTPKPPKPATPNWGQERRMQSRKKKLTASPGGHIGQDVVESSSSSMVVGSCMRFLDFDSLPFDKDSKSHEETQVLGFENFDWFRGKIVTSKRNTPRRRKFQNTSLKASDNLLGDNNKQQLEQDISVAKNQEVDTIGRNYVHFYQRRKKISSNPTTPIVTLQVYRRLYRENPCLLYSRKCGPNFPKLFKKVRTMRKKVKIKINHWYIIADELHKSLDERSRRKHARTTRTNVQNRVNKSKDKKRVVKVKPNPYIDELVPVFLHPRRKRSITRTRLRESLTELPYDFKSYLFRQEQSFLQIAGCIPLQEVPVHIINSFTSPQKKCTRFDNSVGNPNRLQLQEVVVLGGQSLPPEQQDIMHTREDLNEFIASEVEYLTWKIASLDINDQCKELVVRDMNVSGALVKVLPLKKGKMIPKVDLDDETLRVWKLLMENDESEPVEETDKDREEWWEAQRNIFRGRVDSFIAKMHLIQGSRRFSPWKGSVTDSVVGVYLTQNVADHLSSSAFMSVAAKFPARSRSKEVNDNFEVPNSQESVASNAFSKNNEVNQDINASYTDDCVTTATVEPNQSPPQVQNNSSVNENSNTFRKLLEVEEVDYLKQFCSIGIEEIESPLNKSRLEGEEQSAPVTNFPCSDEPSAATSDQNVSSFEASENEFIGQQKPATICSPQSEVTIERGADAGNNHKEAPLESKRNGNGKKKNKSEKKQEPKTDWEEFRKSYCKSGAEEETNVNYRDAVDWDAVRRASVAELAEIIVDRGMNNVIAGYIKDFLDRMYKDHGTLDLEWLRGIPPDKAKEFLLSIQGLGLKSVECVRLLTLHHNAFPVDTNVGRVATRLGWVPLQPLPDAVQIHLLNAYPMVDNIQKYLYPRLCTLDQKKLYELHYQLITFGKVFCTKRNPNCNACPMRAECRHYASAFASGRLALPEAKESSKVIVPAGNEENHLMHDQPPPAFDLGVNNSGSSYCGQSQTCEPIIEVPPSPEPEVESSIGDIEDLCCESDDDEIPTIRLDTQEFRETLETIDTKNVSIPEADMSKALITFSAETANMHVPRKKFVAKSRTMHLVYELPDFHPILAGFEERERDDPTPYLLAIWVPGESPNSLEYTQNRACVGAIDNLEETVKATILIPCRTATRGTFPLNGTYFQVNEVFADDETSHSPMDVPRCLLCNLRIRELGCGSSATSIFKALSTGAIQRLFWKGSICVRGFNRKTREPRHLHRKFHISTTAMAAENRKSGKR